jgi:hypothetical protein
MKLEPSWFNHFSKSPQLATKASTHGPSEDIFNVQTRIEGNHLKPKKTSITDMLWKERQWSYWKYSTPQMEEEIYDKIWTKSKDKIKTNKVATNPTISILFWKSLT